MLGMYNQYIIETIPTRTTNAYHKCVPCSTTHSVDVRQLNHTVIFLIPLLLLFSQVAHAISYTKYLNGTMTITYDNGTTVTPPPGSALYKAHTYEPKELELRNSTWTMYNNTNGSVSKITFHSGIVDGLVHVWHWIRILNGHTHKGYFVPTEDLSNPYDYTELCIPTTYHNLMSNCLQLQVINAEQDHIEFKDQHGGLIVLTRAGGN